MTPERVRPADASARREEAAGQASTTATSRPLFITGILLVGHVSFGILESYDKTLLAIVISHRARAACSGAFSIENGRIRPARTSPASASAS